MIEARPSLGISGKERRQNLDRHIAPQPRIAGAIHFAHAAGT
jgi:hypothetical protein